jgi:glycosyltransferase involved in cell wall biosynthesis
MKIAMIHTPFSARAGGERQILRLAIELEKMGHEIEIFTNSVNENSYPEYFKKVKITVIPHPLMGKLPRGLTPQIATRKFLQTPQNVASEIPSLRRWMQEVVGRQFYTSEVPGMLELGRKIPKGFDIINNHNFPTEWAAFLAKKRLNAPIVWMCNEPPYWFFSQKERKGLRKINWPLFELVDRVSVEYVDEIMVLSHVSEEYIKKAYHKPSRIVRTGVDAELFHNASGENLRRTHGLENSFVLLFIGRSVYARRPDLIRALQILSKRHGDVRLILDTVRERDMLARLSVKLGVKDKVLFLQSASNVELAEVYAACDVFVYPSSASPWGLVVTEAMAASKPVIVSKQVGTSEIIRHGVNGIIIDRAEPEEIAEQVEELMDSPKLRRKIGANAYEYVRENLSWEKYAKNVESVFEDTIAR